MKTVEVGQSWSILVMGRYAGSGRMNLLIERIENGFAFGRTERGHEKKVALRVLRYGLRGSRLNGVPEHIRLPAPDPEPKRIARVIEPKGVPRVGPEVKETLRLREEEKLPIGEIARRMKCSIATINGRLMRAREAQKEERYRNG